jgi:hypothetical protein
MIPSAELKTDYSQCSSPLAGRSSSGGLSGKGKPTPQLQPQSGPELRIWDAAASEYRDLRVRVTSAPPQSVVVLCDLSFTFINSLWHIMVVHVYWYHVLSQNMRILWDVQIREGIPSSLFDIFMMRVLKFFLLAF